MTDYLMGVDVLELNNGGYLLVHIGERCDGEFCAVHNPSDHPLNDSPYLFYTSPLPFLVRVCPHGVAHPDPDSTGYLRSVIRPGQYGYEKLNSIETHLCDGCCVANTIDKEIIQ